MTETPKQIGPGVSSPRWAFGSLLALSCLSAIVLFHDLGGATLFEPDEGRNAEVAREILLTGDWVTPHYAFLPVLDKPIFFYWLIALSYKVFGVSEWSARLPSAMAAFACLLLVGWFAWRFWGPWEGLWSGLILLTGVAYFVLARTVIFDMVFTLFVTLALLGFYWGTTAEPRKKMAFYLLMYAATACATLVKGPLGVILPGMVIFVYLSVSRRWFVLRQMHLLTGAVLFLLIAGPWYLAVEARNPGYLRYFLLQEHFARFLTPRFHRSGPWYMFLLVLAAGFFPWTLLLLKVRWARFRDDKTLFLLVWTILPLVFFSLSSSKQPHYVLPIFPAISILAGEASVRMVGDRLKTGKYLPSILGASMILPLLCVSLGIAWPELAPEPIRAQIRLVSELMQGLFLTIVAVLLFVTAAVIISVTLPLKQGPLYVLCCGTLSVFFYLLQQVTVPISHDRTPKAFAQRSARLISSTDQIVIYDAYVTGLPFYLSVDRPIWLVWPGDAPSVMGSFSMVQKQLRSSASYGKTLFTLQEFSPLWRESRRRLMVFVRQKHLDRLSRDVGAFPKTLLQEDGLLLVTNR